MGGLGLAWMGEPEGLYLEGLGLSSRVWGCVSPGWAGSGSPGWANPRVYILGFRVKFKVLGVCLAWTGGLGLAWMGEPEGLYL